MVYTRNNYTVCTVRQKACTRSGGAEKKMTFDSKIYDVIVVGTGHTGVEAALADRTVYDQP